MSRLARTGQALDEVIDRPMLSLYLPQRGQGQGYVILDVPGGCSRVFPLTDDLQAARKLKRALLVPAALEGELRRLNRQVCHSWRDSLAGRFLTSRKGLCFPG